MIAIKLLRGTQGIRKFIKIIDFVLDHSHRLKQKCVRR